MLYVYEPNNGYRLTIQKDFRVSGYEIETRRNYTGFSEYQVLTWFTIEDNVDVQLVDSVDGIDGEKFILGGLKLVFWEDLKILFIENNEYLNIVD